MIVVEGGKIQLEGTQIEIQAELSTLIYTFNKHNILDKKDLEEAIADGFMTEEELRKDSEERHEIAKQLFPEGHLLHDILKDIFS
jgi:hypothetical protein